MKPNDSTWSSPATAAGCSAQRRRPPPHLFRLLLLPLLLLLLLQLCSERSPRKAHERRDVGALQEGDALVDGLHGLGDLDGRFEAHRRDVSAKARITGFAVSGETSIAGVDKEEENESPEIDGVVPFRRFLLAAVAARLIPWTRTVQGSRPLRLPLRCRWRVQVQIMRRRERSGGKGRASVAAGARECS